MTLTVRSASVTGATTAFRALTHAEMDANWAHVISSANQSFVQSGTGAVSQDLQSRGRLEVLITDFMTDAQRADAILASPTLDHASAMSAALARIMGSQASIATRGGAIRIPGGCRVRLATDPFGVLPNDGNASPSQVPIRIYGDVSDASATGTLNLKGASVIDFRYTTANNAKIDTRGRGVLEMDHLVIADESGNAEPFIFTSNTVILIHDNCFLGSKSSAWDQDCIILGGTSATFGTTASDAPFQGYGSQIYNNHFHKIRRAVYAKVFANGVPVHHNTVWADCGFATGAAFDYDGDPLGSTQTISGVPLHHNLIEVVGYKYGFRGREVIASGIGPNDFYDPTATTTAYYTFGVGSQYNIVYGGYHTDTKTFVEETGTAANTNSWLTGHQSQESRLVQNMTFGGTATARPVARNFSAGNVFGSGLQNSAGDVAQPFYQGTTYTIAHTPNGGAMQNLVSFKDFGTGTTVDLQLEGTATRIMSQAGLIQLQSATQLNSTLAWSGGATITKVRTNTAVLDFADTATGGKDDLTIAVTSAVVGDAVVLGIPNGSIVGGAAGFYAWVSSAGTVTVRFWNASGGNLNPASGTFRVWVIQ